MLARVRRLLPLEDIVYFADQAHVPYGDREPAELLRLLASNVAYLENKGADAIVMGCNTSCAVAAQFGWPATCVPIFDLIAAAAEAVAVIAAARVGILATSATTRSRAYGNALRARAPGLHVQEFAAPRLVPLVEAGAADAADAADALAAVAEACAQFSLPLDALVLACTHYPLLDAQFAAVLGAGVLRIDPAESQARHAATYVAARGGERGTGRTTYVTTGAVEPYAAAVSALSLSHPGEERVFLHAAAAFAGS